VRTFSDWHDPPPGFMEADLVAHSGPTSKGSYVQTLTLTDIATGWTECAPVLVREQKLLTEVLSELRKMMPFALLGFDTDNPRSPSHRSAVSSTAVARRRGRTARAPIGVRCLAGRAPRQPAQQRDGRGSASGGRS
jgi:hypothetical protein